MSTESVHDVGVPEDPQPVPEGERPADNDDDGGCGDDSVSELVSDTEREAEEEAAEAPEAPVAAEPEPEPEPEAAEAAEAAAATPGPQHVLQRIVAFIQELSAISDQRGLKMYKLLLQKTSAQDDRHQEAVQRHIAVFSQFLSENVQWVLAPNTAPDQPRLRQPVLAFSAKVSFDLGKIVAGLTPDEVDAVKLHLLVIAEHPDVPIPPDTPAAGKDLKAQYKAALAERRKARQLLQATQQQQQQTAQTGTGIGAVAPGLFGLGGGGGGGGAAGLDLGPLMGIVEKLMTAMPPPPPQAAATSTSDGAPGAQAPVPDLGAMIKSVMDSGIVNQILGSVIQAQSQQQQQQPSSPAPAIDPALIGNVLQALLN
jgi:hypothetical protein